MKSLFNTIQDSHCFLENTLGVSANKNRTLLLVHTNAVVRFEDKLELQQKAKRRGISAESLIVFVDEPFLSYKKSMSVEHTSKTTFEYHQDEYDI